MDNTLQQIANHYISRIITSDRYLSPNPVRDTYLLFPPFKTLLDELITLYTQNSNDEIYILETYRSNTLQLAYYNRGASKIRSNGMHHYGIAVDLVRGKSGKYLDYKLNYVLLRKLANNLGLTVLNFEDAHYQFIPVSLQDELRSTVKTTVINFQKNNKLVPDGIVGPKTIAKANELFI